LNSANLLVSDCGGSRRRQVWKVSTMGGEYKVVGRLENEICTRRFALCTIFGYRNSKNMSRRIDGVGHDGRGRLCPVFSRRPI
jgi:hypothetical protein